MIYNRIQRDIAFKDNSILPLINIIFLLIIFFLVLGRLYPSAIKNTDIPTLSTTQKYHGVKHTFVIDKNGILYNKENKIINIKTLQFKKNTTVSLAVNKNLKATSFIETLNTFKRKGIKNITIITKNTTR